MTTGQAIIFGVLYALGAAYMGTIPRALILLKRWRWFAVSLIGDVVVGAMVWFTFRTLPPWYPIMFLGIGMACVFGTTWYMRRRGLIPGTSRPAPAVA